MPTRSTVLFDSPCHSIAESLGEKLATAIDIRIVVGFMTPDGVIALESSLRKGQGKLRTLVVGAGTFKAFMAFEHLINNLGISLNCLFVHLGHTRAERRRDGKPSYEQYHPMLHSKIYYMEHANGQATAIIGSHNLTDFALNGHNGEAAVLLEGDKNADEFICIRRHIDMACQAAVPYESKRKEEYSRWMIQYLQGMRTKFDDAYSGENITTIVILCQKAANLLLSQGHTLYFEIPAALAAIRQMKVDVHVYAFDKLPSSPKAGLNSLNSAQSYWCKIVGFENEGAGYRLQANWCIDNPQKPILKSIGNEKIELQPSQERLQLRAKIYQHVRGRFRYHFNPPPKLWEPVFGTDKQAKNSHDEGHSSTTSAPAGDSSRQLIRELSAVEPAKDRALYLAALEKINSHDASYVMVSSRREEV